MDTKVASFVAKDEVFSVRMLRYEGQVHLLGRDLGAVVEMMDAHNFVRLLPEKFITKGRLLTTMRNGRSRRSHVLWVSEEGAVTRLVTMKGDVPAGLVSWVGRECKKFREEGGGAVMCWG